MTAAARQEAAAAQVSVKGTKTVWGQQHGPLTLRPGGREFEPAALSASESARLLDLFMQIEAPASPVVRGVHAAADWWRLTAFYGYAYEDNELVARPGAGPLWLVCMRLARTGRSSGIAMVSCITTCAS